MEKKSFLGCDLETFFGNDLIKTIFVRIQKKYLGTSQQTFLCVKLEIGEARMELLCMAKGFPLF